jgi:energy-coupling factor transporter ATP-binding protein EcfA2
MEKDLFTQLKSRYDAFKEKQGQLGEDVILALAEPLLNDIRNAGRLIIPKTQREDLARIASDLGEIIYSISGVYPIMRLDPLPSHRAEWLQRLGFKRDPFLYTDGGTDPFLQEYFYFGMRHFYNVFDVSKLGTIFVFGPPGSGKSSLRNVISQLGRKENIFPVVYQDFGPLVRKHQRGEGVQVEDHVTQISKTALRTLVKLADEEAISLLTGTDDRSRIIRNQLWLYVSKYEDEPLGKHTLEGLLKPGPEAVGVLPTDARELLGRFCWYVTELFDYQSVYVLVDPDDDIAPDEKTAWQVLEPLLSTRRLLELPDKVAFKFFLSQEFRERALQIPWIEQEWNRRVYQLEWPDEELRALLRERLRQSSEGRYNSLGELSEVGDLDDYVIRPSVGNPRNLIVICDRLFSEHGRKWSPEDREPLLIMTQEVHEALRPFEERHRESVLERLIARGESERVEFKSTMRYNRKAGRADKEMGREIAKTLCAFMNTEGGTLIIGVDDDGMALGLDYDFSTLGSKKNQDGFEQAFAKVVGDYLSPEADQYIRSHFEAYQDKSIYVVKVEKSPKPVFCLFDGVRSFYVRSMTIKRKLDVQDTLDYVIKHFGL